MTLLSDSQFTWFGILGTLGIVVGWGIRDVLLLRRTWPDRANQGDEVFGSIMGLVMITLGAIGLLLHFLGR